MLIFSTPFGVTEIVSQDRRQYVVKGIIPTCDGRSVELMVELFASETVAMPEADTLYTIVAQATEELYTVRAISMGKLEESALRAANTAVAICAGIVQAKTGNEVTVLYTLYD